MDDKVPMALMEAGLPSQASDKQNDEPHDYPIGPPPTGANTENVESQEALAQASFDFAASMADNAIDAEECLCKDGETDKDCNCAAKAIHRMDLCPHCGNNALVYESGCETCIVCGYSRC
jgi:hypothetical protein